MDVCCYGLPAGRGCPLTDVNHWDWCRRQGLATGSDGPLAGVARWHWLPIGRGRLLAGLCTGKSCPLAGMPIDRSYPLIGVPAGWSARWQGCTLAEVIACRHLLQVDGCLVLPASRGSPGFRCCVLGGGFIDKVLQFSSKQSHTLPFWIQCHHQPSLFPWRLGDCCTLLPRQTLSAQSALRVNLNFTC